MVRRRFEWRVHEQYFVELADHAAADGERSASGLRAALRHDGEYRSGSAARAAPAGQEHPRLRPGRDLAPQSTPGAQGPNQVCRVSRLGPGHRAAHPEGRGTEFARAARGRSADGDPERLRGPREADDGLAGPLVSDRPDAYQHVHAGEGSELTRISGDRRLRLASSRIASSERTGEARAAP